MYSLNKSLPNINLNASSNENELDLRHILTEKSQGGGVSLKQKHTRSEWHSTKRRRFTIDSSSRVLPMYKQYQLLGDSQMVRFSEQLLSLGNRVTYTEDTNSRHIGYCVSGQKISKLKHRLESEEFPVCPSVIMLIGTNDIVYNTDIDSMRQNYCGILKILKKKCRKVVLLTIPPVARFEHCNRHWNTLKRVNGFIQQQADDDQVVVLDLCSLFVSYDNTVSKEYYESVFHKGPKIDLIHLNRKGFLLLKCLLDINCEDSYGDSI